MVGGVRGRVNECRGGGAIQMGSCRNIAIAPIDPDCWCKRLCMLKNSVIGMSFWLRISLLPSFFFLARIQAEPGRSQFGISNSVGRQKVSFLRSLSHMHSSARVTARYHMLIVV
jgi:hypothetical protein